MEKFDKKQFDAETVLAERIKLWSSIVKDSIFSEEVQGRFLRVIEERFAKNKPINESTEDWIYFSISRLLIVAEQAIKEGLPKQDVMPVFENLRDDIWLFYKELNK